MSMNGCFEPAPRTSHIIVATAVSLNRVTAVRPARGSRFRRVPRKLGAATRAGARDQTAIGARFDQTIDPGVTAMNGGRDRDRTCDPYDVNEETSPEMTGSREL